MQALQQLQAATAALDRAVGSGNITQADLDRATDAITDADCYGGSNKKMAADLIKARNLVNSAKLRLHMVPGLA